MSKNNKKQRQADFIQIMRAKKSKKFAKGLEIDKRIAEASKKTPY